MVHMDRHKFKPYLNSCELLTEFVVLKNELPRIAYNLDYEYSYITYQFPTRTSIQCRKARKLTLDFANTCRILCGKV